MEDKIKSVIQRAVERDRARQSIDVPVLSLVVDTSAIRIAELEAQLTEVAHNLNTSVDRVLTWSADVGQALTLMDDTLEDNEKLRATLNITKAHLTVAAELPKSQDATGYIDAALHVLNTVPIKEVPHA